MALPNSMMFREAAEGAAVIADWLARNGQAVRAVAAPYPPVAPLLTVQRFYRAIDALALRRGHNPALLSHLNKVTETV